MFEFQGPFLDLEIRGKANASVTLGYPPNVQVQVTSIFHSSLYVNEQLGQLPDITIPQSALGRGIIL